MHLIASPPSRSAFSTKYLRLLAIAAKLAVLLLPLAGCSGGVLDPQGPIGAANTKILLNALGIMLVIAVAAASFAISMLSISLGLMLANALPAAAVELKSPEKLGMPSTTING